MCEKAVEEFKQLLRDAPSAIFEPPEGETFTSEEECIIKYIKPELEEIIEAECAKLLNSQNFKFLEESATNDIEDSKFYKIKCFRNQLLQNRIAFLKRKLAEGNARSNKLMDKVNEIRQIIQDTDRKLDEL